VQRGFTWRDGERIVRFGRGALADAPDLLGEGFTLVTTARALAQAPALAERAAAVHEIGPGLVDDLAGDLLGEVDADLVVGLGGGRPIDVAKALAAARSAGVAGAGAGRTAARGPLATRAAAIPTTLSAAEMTATHRPARGVDPRAPRVRPAVVVNDPALSASQPPPGLFASAANSLAHAVEAPVTTEASPVPGLAALEAARLTATAIADPGAPDRDALALAALLSGYAIDAARYGLHHVCSQTLARVAGAGHGPANAAMLPHTAGALRRRAPGVLARLDAAAGLPVEELAGRLGALAGAGRLRDAGVAEDRLAACADAAAVRPELAFTPPAASAQEIAGLYRAAW
jgi:alcohol dehydrogenase class IV